MIILKDFLHFLAEIIDNIWGNNYWLFTHFNEVKIILKIIQIKFQECEKEFTKFILPILTQDGIQYTVYTSPSNTSFIFKDFEETGKQLTTVQQVVTKIQSQHQKQRKSTTTWQPSDFLTIQVFVLTKDKKKLIEDCKRRKKQEEKKKKVVTTSGGAGGGGGGGGRGQHLQTHPVVHEQAKKAPVVSKPKPQTKQQLSTPRSSGGGGRVSQPVTVRQKTGHELLQQYITPEGRHLFTPRQISALQGEGTIPFQTLTADGIIKKLISKEMLEKGFSRAHRQYKLFKKELQSYIQANLRLKRQGNEEVLRSRITNLMTGRNTVLEKKEVLDYVNSFLDGNKLTMKQVDTIVKESSGKKSSSVTSSVGQKKLSVRGGGGGKKSSSVTSSVGQKKLSVRGGGGGGGGDIQHRVTPVTRSTSTSTSRDQGRQQSSVKSLPVFSIRGGGSSAVPTTNGKKKQVRPTQGYAQFLDQKHFQGMPISLPGLDAFRQKKYNIFGE